MQDYFNLTWSRIWDALRDSQMRQALWDIWFDRDYTLYGQLTGKNFDLSQWDPGERTRLYVRKDVAGQIWEYGVGPTELTGGVTEDPYAQGRQTLAAVAVWGSTGPGDGQFDAPRGVAVGPDGSVYVADSRNHRIQKFDADGNLLLAWGTFGSVDAGTASPGAFNEPWGVAVGPDGAVYVADTWNHRVQKFTADGAFVTMWGRSGQGDALDAFFGPRGIAVDAQGRVFLTDTGNHRVVVFDPEGRPLMSVGMRGFDSGFFDEPVGLAFDPSGNLYVADTWNQRVQVFAPNVEGEFVFAREWQIIGWYGQSLDNKPYLALDGQGRVYAADPEGYRVLVFDSQGQFVTTWGDFGEDAMTFSLASGVAVDAAGNVYVTDGKSNRVLKFPPLP
jgi:DNA-binding beta-propeller fold protein YncE